MNMLRSVNNSVKAMARAVMKPAEDPRQMASNPYERQRELLEQMRLALGQLSQARRRLQASLSSLERKQRRLEQVARLALVSGKEDKARLALKQNQTARPGVNALRLRLSQVQEQERGLRTVEKELGARLNEYRFQSEIVRVRSAAEARLDEALASSPAEFPQLALILEQAQLESQRMEADSAIDRLVGLLEATAGAGDATGPALDEAVEQELTTLKSQLDGLNPAADPSAEKERS